MFFLQSGKIAEELEHVNHHVRTKLDEIKRTELERLRLAAMKHVRFFTNHISVSNADINSNDLSFLV